MRWFAWKASLKYWLAGMAVVTAGNAAEGPQLTLETIGRPASSVTIRATNAGGAFLRLDSSENLRDWAPLEVFPNFSGVVEFTDVTISERQFFRTVEVSPGLALQSPRRKTVRPGELLSVYGQFFAREAPGDNYLRLGEVEIPVRSATSTRLTGEIPANASSGSLTLTTPGGTVTLATHLVVLAEAEVRINLPAGLAGRAYAVANTYGVGDSRLTVPRGVPLMNFAFPRDGSRRGLLLALSQNDSPVVFDENSTAIALVFFHPAFRTMDPEVAAGTLSRLGADLKVQALAKLYTAKLAAGLDPFSERDFSEAYAAALVSAAEPLSSEGRLSSLAVRQVFDSTGLRFVTLSGKAGQAPVAGSVTGNPFDWAVMVSQVDVEKAFPLGRRDFQDLTSGKGRFPDGLLTPLPTLEGTTRQFVVAANFWTDYYDVPAKIVEAVKEKLGYGEEDEELDGLETDALYVMRAISPALAPADQRAFAESKYPNQLFRAQALNIAHLLLDLAGVLVDLSVVEEDFDSTAELVKEAEKILAKVTAAQPLDSAAKWRSLAWDLSKDFATEKLTGELEDALGEWIETVFRFAGQQINLLGKLKNAENVLERVISGLYFATPLETGFIEVGDPFPLKILQVEPEGGSVGDTVTITVSGQYFDKNRALDKILFTGGGAPVDRASLRVEPLSDNQQNIICQVPGAVLDLPLNVRTNPALTVIAAGRRGDGTFNFVERPTVTRLTPGEGFAAAGDYLGAPFAGTPVRLQGFGFGPDERYFFGGTEATNKSGLRGDMTVLAPAGAKSGPIRIVRDSGTPRESSGFSPEFTVFGPPTIASHGPDAGPVGSSVRVVAQNLGSGPAQLQLNALPLAEVRLAGDRIAGIIPLDAVSGPIRVVTPAGEASFDFGVTAGLAPGGFIDVGGPSLITLARAFEFISGELTPPWSPGCAPGLDCVDDEDIRRDESGNPIENLDFPDKPLEEGDFMTDNGTQADPPRFPFSRLHSDTVVITNTVEGNFTVKTNSLFDTITGAPDGQSVIKGQLVLQGRHCTLINLTVEGQLRIEGDDNEINVRVFHSPNDGVVITGHANKVTVECVSNTYDGLVIDGGTFNQVTVKAMANGNNGVTLKNGARGNRISATTGRHDPVTGHALADSGNGAHGIALLAAARDNLIAGIDFIAGNKADGLYLSGAGVMHNEFAILNSTANGGNGFTVRDGASDNSLHDLVAQGNGASGFVLLGGANNFVRNLRTGENTSCGVRITGVVDTNTFVAFDARSNRVAALRVDGGTQGIVCEGTSLTDTNGLQVAGAETIGNWIKMRIRASVAEGALVQAASANQLRLDISGCGSSGLVLEEGAAENDLRDLRVNDCGSHGVLVRGDGTRGNRFPNAAVGIALPGEPVGNKGDGFRIEAGATANVIGGPGDTCLIQDNAGVGVRITGAKTQGNVVVHSLIGETPGGYAQTAGIVVADGAANTIISDNTISGHAGPGVEIVETPGIILGPQPGLPNPNKITSNEIGVRLAGAATVGTHIFSHEFANNSVGVLLAALASGNGIGPDNEFHDGANGVSLDNAQTNRIERNFVHDHTGPGFRASNGASGNRFIGNFITANSVGVEIDGAATLWNTISANSITANAGPGIRLLNGGNRELPAPVITSIGSQRVFGASAAPASSSIELFSDPADEGQTLLERPRGGRTVLSGQFVVPVNLVPAAVGSLFKLHATVTDPEGNTSEFGGTDLGSSATTPIVFTSTRDGNREIYLTDNLGATAARLTDHPANDEQPALSPDGSRIAFVSNRDGNAEIYLLKIGDTNPPVRITTEPGADTEPAWSPDGTQIVFVSNRSGNADIFVMKADGTGASQLTFDLHADRSPGWSPDGTTIVFSSDRTGTEQIWLMNADGTNPRRLLATPSSETHPAWSPDGLRIAFVSDRDGNWEIYDARPDGSDPQRITDHPSADLHPAWMPNSEVLVFTSNRSTGFELFLVRRFGGAPERLTVSDGDNIEPRTR